MIRIVKMSGKYYGKEIDIDDDNDIGDIETFVDEGTPCILVDDLEDLDNLELNIFKVIMVE